jgi:uncharacterized repeat protein (TIGR01451 family)
MMMPSPTARARWTAGRWSAGKALLLLASASPLAADNLSTAVDLAVHAQRVGRGDTLTFEVTVSNESGGATAAPGSQVQVWWREGFEAVSWTASFSGGATGTAGGSGPVAESVDLPVGGGVVYTVTGTVVAGLEAGLTPERFLDLYGAVTPPVGFVDDDPTDDRAARQLLVERVGPGGGHFLAGQEIAHPDSTFALAPGDLDGDGTVDLFWSPFFGAGDALVNDGAGTFSASGQTLGAGQHGEAALGDVDDDGDLDAWQTSVGGSDVLWLNQGGVQAGTPGSFTDSGQVLDGGFGSVPVFADLDQDGDLDLFLGRSGSASDQRVWINQGGIQAGAPGDFADAGPMPGTEANTQGVAVGDVDGDGDLDVFLANALDDHQLLLGDGSGGFSISPQSFPAIDAQDAAFGDLDNDGDLDLYLVRFAGHDLVLLNQGGAQGGTLGELADSGAAIGPASGGDSSVTLADTDGDGDLDAIVAFYNTFPSQLYRNDGNGGFSASGELAGAQPALLAKTADIDGDGDFDLLLGGFLSAADQVFLNVPGAPPVIGLAKRLTSVTDLGGGVLDVGMEFLVENHSVVVALSDVQVSDDLDATFPPPSTYTIQVGPGTTGTLTANPSFDGSGDPNLLVPDTSSLAPGAFGTISVTVRVTLNGTDGPFFNSATATGEGPTGVPTTDVSDDGTDPDPNGNDDPGDPGENDPTVIPVPPAPDVWATKESTFDLATQDHDGSGTLTPGDALTYTIVITNDGTADAKGLLLDDTPDVRSTLMAGSVTATQGTIVLGNTGGDTSVQVDLGTLASGGASAMVTFEVTIDDPLPPEVTEILNQGLVSGSNMPTLVTDDPSTPTADDPTLDLVGRPAMTIPTLSEWMLMLLAVLLATAASRRLRTGIGLSDPGSQVTPRLP